MYVLTRPDNTKAGNAHLNRSPIIKEIGACIETQSCVCRRDNVKECCPHRRSSSFNVPPGGGIEIKEALLSDTNK